MKNHLTVLIAIAQTIENIQAWIFIVCEIWESTQFVAVKSVIKINVC